MRKSFGIILGAGLIALAGCGGQGDDALAEKVEAEAEAKADVLDAAAENATTDAGEERLEDEAEIVRETGEAKADAIDDVDLIVTNAQ